MARICVLVQLEVKPGEMEGLLEAARVHARRSVDEEPGCISFDILRPRGEENRLVYVEMYTDQAALDAHASTDRIAAFREFMAPRLESRTLAICEVDGS